MTDDDMRWPPSRCNSTSSVTYAPSRMPDPRRVHHNGRAPFEYHHYQRASLHPSAPRKESLATNSIFSFLQRFRAKNRSLFDDANSLPASPRSSRAPAGTPGCRWESVESVLSSATATSFAFIPPATCHQSKPLKPVNRCASSAAATADCKSARENCAFLRAKYNLLGSDATLYHHPRDSRTASTATTVVAQQNTKKLHRNSVGNVENLASFWVADDHTLDRHRPYSANGDNTLRIRRSHHCHRPGKRRAPQPPTHPLPNTQHSRQNPNGARKKRKAPSPPKQAATMADERVADNAAVCNDSLKLERGVLKANKLAVAKPAAATTETVCVPVSPKPWYKRSATQPNLRSVTKTSDKKKSCEQLLDEWMLEAGLPRSASFYERKLDHQTSISESATGNPKRRSQISMLANISELDREAAEIVRKERRRERDNASSVDDKFYVATTAAPEAEVVPKTSSESSATGKRTTSKDLLSILNAITNVTRITVNTSFFKETLTKTSASHEAKSNCATKSPEKRPANCATLTELANTSGQGSKASSPEPPTAPSLEKVQPPIAALAVEPVKPVKPFSNWMCPQCTLENPSWKFICEACNKWRPYSVYRFSNGAKVTPKADVKLKPEEVLPTKDASNCVTQPSTGTLAASTSEPGPTALSGAPEPQPNSEPGPASADPSNLFNEVQSADNIEDVRKARLAFFARSKLNDLSADDGPAKPSNADAKNKSYSEEDRRKLREILKELKDSLPKADLLGDKSAKRKVTVHSPAASKESKPATDRGASRKASNVDRAGRSKSNEKAEAYFITRRTVVEGAASTSAQVASGGDDVVELKVPIVECEIRQDGVVRTDAGGEEVIRLRMVDVQRAQPDTGGATAVATPAGAKKREPNDVAGPSEDRKRSNAVSSKETKNLPSVAVNRLLQKLQTAIASGQHHEAANIARELARLKVNCNMTRQDTPETQLSLSEDIQNISINIHVQKRDLPRDSIRLKISPHTTINELQTKISKEHGIPVTNQQLIFGTHPVTDASATLDQIGVNSNGMIMFLKIVNTEIEEAASSQIEYSVKHAEKDIACTSRQHNPELIEDNVESSNFGKTIASKARLIANSARENHCEVVPESGALDTTESAPKYNEIEEKVEPLAVKNEPPQNTQEWVCLICTLINEGTARLCAACGRIRPEIVATPIHNQRPMASPEIKKETPQTKPTSYHELMDLEKTDLIANVEAFDCAVCLATYNMGEGVVLKDCLHTFCRDCLSQTVEHCVEAEVKCPYRDAEYSCESVLQEREIKALVTAETFEKHLARSVAEAENKIKNAFHCKTANCRGWCIFEDNVNEFRCPVCSKTNCLTCQVIHSGLNCKQYQEVINKESETNADANRTRLMLQEMLQKGEAMTCPTCEVILMKKWGCDWLRCSMCKTEICWVTRGPRWGPKGKGDTSGGCRCGVNGVKCHQKCTFCH